MINDARCAHEINLRTTVAKASFNKQKALPASKLGLNLRGEKKLVKCYTWSTALYGAETWMFGRQIINSSEVLKCGAGEGLRGSVVPIM